MSIDQDIDAIYNWHQNSNSSDDQATSNEEDIDETNR